VLDFDYGTTNERDDILSRVSALKKSNDTRCAYTYLGLDQWLEANYAEPGVKLTYLKQTGDPDFPPGDPRDPGDQYTGLDRFGRVQDQRWLKTSDGTHRERVQYGYDRANNRIWRQNLVAGTGQDEFYTYDGLYQVSRLKRGTLNTNKTDISGTPTWQEDFAYDATGNWHGTASAYVTRTNGVVDLDQNRSHNQVNEITDITETTGPAWVTPVHDAAGNMTTIPQPNSPTDSYDCTWDAWNRLVQMHSGQTKIAEYAYDGLARRLTKTDISTTRHYYYSDKWQVLEERTGSNPETASAERQFVWGLRHLDDLILRDRPNTTPSRLYALQDAMSVTAVGAQIN